MQIQNEPHIFKGLQRDLSISKYDTSFLYDAQNIRLTAREEDTLLSVTNEKGPKDLNLTINGTYLGHCLLNEYLVVMSTTSTVDTAGSDYITRINLKDLTSKELYNGSLNFSPLYPIEAIGSYENNSIQKVYWTDGYNQPRIINIAPTYDDNIKSYNSNSFDFVQSLKLNETVIIEKEYGSGQFPPGVIQYAFTYYNNHKQESNIFYTSPLQYIAFKNRGGNPEEKVANSFKITVARPDTNFDYLRIYSILRTSIDATPVVKRLQDIKIPSSSEFPEFGGSYYHSDTGAPTRCSISKDDGLTFDLFLGTIWDNDNPWFTITNSDLKSKWDTWVNYNSDSEITPLIYTLKYTKAEVPNLVIKIISETDIYYFGWNSDTKDDATIYIGWRDVSGGYIVLSENSDGTENDIVLRKTATYVPHITYIDNGESGEDVDPTELLYKGGEELIAQTIEQKDGTLFLGNITTKRSALPADVTTEINKILKPKSTDPEKESTGNITIKTTLVESKGIEVTTGDFAYTNSIEESGFKGDEIYRIGIQFQYKTGKWSEPVWLRDYKITERPTSTDGKQTKIPQVEVTISNDDTVIRSALLNAGYKRARLLMAQPTEMDRTILCQGIVNPTIYRNSSRYTIKSDGTLDATTIGSLYAQSSWIFRPRCDNHFPTDARYSSMTDEGVGYIPSSGDIVDLTTMYGEGDATTIYPSPWFRSVEIGITLKDNDKFKIDKNLITFHSPDLEFNDYLSHHSWGDTVMNVIGQVTFSTTYGDIDIQTSSSTIGGAAGFIPRSIKTTSLGAALASGPFYEDYLVDDNKENSVISYSKYSKMQYPVLWPVYMWHHSGSLNNDVNRSGRSAELLKKKISNYHIGTSNEFFTGSKKLSVPITDIQLFSSDQLSLIKVGNNSYMGNIDTAISSSYPDAKFIIGNPYSKEVADKATFFTNSKYALWYGTNNITGFNSSTAGVWEFSSNKLWKLDDSHKDIGEYVNSLCNTSEPVRMKYKSTPHLVINPNFSSLSQYGNVFNSVGDGCLPIVEITVPYNSDTLYGGRTDDAIKANLWLPISEPVNISASVALDIISNQGDTYYQRFECLKTYAYTSEDVNQVIDIASFLVETHINIDGRYDRNRGQVNNLNASPINFNLINKVYSQRNNFFNYRILDEDYYKITNFPNQITWTKEKQAGADVDLWTNVTLASIYNLDGSKGEIVSLNTWKDNIYCFQDKGISNILFNSRVQIPASDGVPIEISNSYKVDGYRYISDGTGCNKNSKRTIKETPTGIYFIENATNNLYHVGESLTDVSTSHNMTTWFKNNTINRTVYDSINHDLYLISDTKALCFSEVLGQFTSFMDYAGISLIESYNKNVYTMYNSKLYQMFKGEYNIFFGTYYPWSITFISNGIARSAVSNDKIFSNIEYRMDLKTNDYLHEDSFDYIQVTNEYQDTGVVPLSMLKNMPSNLKKKLRIWHIDIPRNKDTRDRIRNTWCKIKLGMWDSTNTLFDDSKKSAKAELHDLNVQYYI